MASILVSEAEKVYVLHGVQEDLRCDGRGRKDVRPIVVETDIGNRYFYLIFLSTLMIQPNNVSNHLW